MHSLRKIDLGIRQAEYEDRRSMATANEKRPEEALQIQRDQMEINRKRARAEEKKLDAETAQILRAAMEDKAKDRESDVHFKLLSNRK